MLRKVMLRQRQSPGDILTATRAFYDLKRDYPDWQIGVESPCPELFDNSPHLTVLDKNDPEVEVYDIRYDDINESGWDGLHFKTAFANDIERKLNNPLMIIESPDDKPGYVKQIESGLRSGSIPSTIYQLFAQSELPIKPKSNVVPCTSGGWWMDSKRFRVRNVNGELHIDYSIKEKWQEKYGEIHITSTGLFPEIYLSDDEKSWYNQVHCDFLWDGPFWLLNAGRKSDNELKQYHRWQAVVDLLNDHWQGKVRIVQIGHRGSGGISHIHPELTGVFNLIGQTSLRQLARLTHWSEGTIGPISFQFVLAAAFLKPCVVVAGGKEGTRWHLYNGVKWIDKVGCLQCAVTDGCWKGGTKGDCVDLVKAQDMDIEVPRCFEMTSPLEIANRVMDYYKGGRVAMPENELWHVADDMKGFDVGGSIHPFYESGEALPKGFVEALGKKPKPKRAKYVSGKDSKIYHLDTCRIGNTIKVENALTYASPEMAEKTGKKPCKICLGAKNE